MSKYIVLHELYHHGIKGQKWGYRRYQNEDGSLTPEGLEKYKNGGLSLDYRPDQRERDKSIYSNGAVKRIDKKMLNGQQISGARSSEADRIEKFRNSAKINKEVGKILGTIGGATLGFFAGNRLSDHLDKYSKLNSFGRVTRDMAPMLMLAGGAAVGNTLGKIGGQSIPMLVGGYSPSKAEK